MFLKKGILTALMKQAYKSGLRVARTQGWIYLAGSYWEVNIKEEFMPKETKGELIKLIGTLPEIGEKFVATKDGNQMEIGTRVEIDDSGFPDDAELTLTNFILIGTAGTRQRLLQDEETGNIYVVNSVFIEIVDNGAIMEDKGEWSVEKILFHPVRGILLKNNVCKLHALFRDDERNEKELKALKGVDITPEVV